MATLRRAGAQRVDLPRAKPVSVPAETSSNPAIIRRVEVLPQPEEPSRRDDLARPDLEVEVAHGVDLVRGARIVDAC